MIRTRMSCALVVSAWTLLLPGLATAEVARVEMTAPKDVLGGRSFGSSGAYELVTGKIYFTLDPANARNRVITDIDKAARDGAGRVECSADLWVLRPKDASKGNGVALVDIVNRGRKTVLTGFNGASASADLTAEAEFGDGLLLRHGYTVVWVGWEFDVPKRDGMIRIDVPSAAGVTGLVRAFFTPDAHRPDFTVADLGTYTPSQPAAENTLSVRDGMTGAPSAIAHDKWRLTGNVVTLDGGFEAGRTYELTYQASNPPVAGLGFAAVRDTASWLKYARDALVSVRYAYAFGSSQSGRFLRDFLYHGFNSDERNRQAFDAVMANIAGASRTDLNTRGATPTAQAQFTATSFPFADAVQHDPVSGAEEGALDNARARQNQPKIFYTNTGVEYWGGARSAALIHTAVDGSKDLSLPDNERIYFLTGSQHGPARFPSAVTTGQQRDNPNNYWWTMRALLVAMDKWVRDRVPPPASRYPRLQDGTLVRPADVAFPNVPTVTSPRSLSPGKRAPNHLVAQDGAPGTPLPYLVPQVDLDGNERAGIRLPDVAVPLATYTGWNFRKPSIGAPTQLFPLLGPRASIEERYPSRDQYLALVQEAGSSLVRDRYLLAEDLPRVVERATDQWDLLTRRPAVAAR
jgi:hypothetical protein